MAKNILFYLDLFTLHFALADYLKRNLNCNLFAMIDTTDKPKTFFLNQKIVDFNETWFYHDNIDFKKIPDIKYLDDFSKRYEIDLKKLIKNDRHFNHFNEFYKFTENQKNSIVEQESKLYESIIEKSKPDFLIITQPAVRHSYMLLELCKKNNVTPLVINPSLLGYQIFISKNINRLNSYKDENIIPIDKSFSELQNDLEKFNINNQITEYISNFGGDSKLNFLSAVFTFLIKNNNSNVKTHYTYYGRTKFNVLINSLKKNIRKRKRKKFIDKNFKKKISDDKIIYFPLQVEPDRNLLLGAPNYTNQLKSIEEISKNLPSGFRLIVKEHPGQKKTWRPISYYDEILKNPLVDLIHPDFPSGEIYKKCNLVITAVGTSGFEALFHGIPVIVFDETLYSDIPGVTKLNSLAELENEIPKSLEKKINPKDLDFFIKILQKNSVNFDLFGYYTAQASEFYYNSILIDVDIPENKMRNFLQKQNKIINNLGNELIKQINSYSTLT